MQRDGGGEFLVVLPSADPAEAEVARRRLEAALQAASASCAAGSFRVTLGVHAGDDPEQWSILEASNPRPRAPKGSKRAQDGL